MQIFSERNNPSLTVLQQIQHKPTNQSHRINKSNNNNKTNTNFLSLVC